MVYLRILKGQGQADELIPLAPVDPNFEAWTREQLALRDRYEAMLRGDVMMAKSFTTNPNARALLPANSINGLIQTLVKAELRRRGYGIT